MAGGPIEPWPSESASSDAVRDALAGEPAGFVALGATLSPVWALRACHDWLVGVGIDPGAAAVTVVAAAVVRWAVGVSLFATRAIAW